jgi:uncharacterized surface protein with fasciclin (FAS1) repeats
LSRTGVSLAKLEKRQQKREWHSIPSRLNPQICRLLVHVSGNRVQISVAFTFFAFFAKTCYVSPVACGVVPRDERYERFPDWVPLKNEVRFEMEELTSVLTTGLLALAVTAEAESKFNGTATTARSSVRHVLTTVSRPAEKDIVDTAIGAGSSSIRVAAVGAAGRVETLKVRGPFTAFAGTVEILLLPENKEELVAILTYHVLSGNVVASEVVNLKSATTVNGKDAMIKVSDKGVMVDAAKAVAADIEASNGVIHVIDSVILP